MNKKCIRDDGYEHCLTIGKFYDLKENGEIIEGRHLVIFIGDDGKSHCCHLSRFE